MNVNFTPGPSQLYYTVADHARKAFKEGVPSLSHRSKEFEAIFQKATDGLKELLLIPPHFHIFFTSSATEIWEKSVQNLVEKNSLHFVNGAFSKRYYEIALQLGRKAVKIESPLGEAFVADQPTFKDAELIALTHNETSTGVSLTNAFINQFKEKNPKALIVVDAVSSLPYPSFDYSKIDSVFFSVQKGFGMPAGLGVWAVNDRCIAKAESLLAKGISIGSYHNLPTLLLNAKKNQTTETPNVLGIYLLSCVVEDFLRIGIKRIRQETEYKATILYQALASSPLATVFVKDPAIQSKTVIVAECGEHAAHIIQHLSKHGFYPGDGYGEKKKTQLRFANFPAHSKEQYEHLVDLLAKVND
jgi:phosphoserine aminotransferase